MSLWASEFLILKQSIWGIECVQPFLLVLITEMLDSSGDAFVTYTVVSRLDCIPCRAKIDKFGIKWPLFSRLYPTTLDEWYALSIFILQHDLSLASKKDSENL